MAADMLADCAFRQRTSVPERTDTEPSTAHPPGMKSECKGLGQNVSRIDLSVEAVLKREIARLGQWLTAQGLDPQNDDAHADEGSRDRLFLRYGVFIGLKQALALLTDADRTVHNHLRIAHRPSQA